MACVFRHLLKKWRLIADHSHELSLHACRVGAEPGSFLYEHTCASTTLREFCGTVVGVTTIKYSWEDYVKDASISDTLSSQEISREDSRDVSEASRCAPEASQDASHKIDDTKPLWENVDFCSILQSFELDEPISDCLIVPLTLCCTNHTSPSSSSPSCSIPHHLICNKHPKLQALL